MAFTPEEQAILCELAYEDIVSSETDPKSLSLILAENEAKLKSELGSGYDKTLEGLKKKVAGEDYKVVLSVDDDCNSGFVAFAIAGPQNEVTVVCRGSEDLTQVKTNPGSRKDLDTDLQIWGKRETDQQQAMEDFMDVLERKGYDSYYFTGHSLGGNLAIHGSIYIGDPNQVKGVTTFNAPGFNIKYWSIHQMRINQIEGKIVNYENEYDYVSSIFTKPGATFYIDSHFSSDDYGFDHHKISGLRIRDGGFVGADCKDSRTEDVYKISNNLLNWPWVSGIIGRYIYQDICGGPLTGFRDFSQSALNVMTAAAQETQEEEWWDFTRWDCWYRLDNAFGGPIMDFQLLTGDVNTYYRKIIDMNDATVTDIQNIFQKVYEIDGQYAEKIRTKNTELTNQVLSKIQNLAESVTPSAG